MPGPSVITRHPGRVWFIGAILLPLVTSGSLCARGIHGTIQGSVRDGSSHAPLIGAVVIVVGTRWGATVDVDGRFSIAGVRAGEYDVRVAMIGYRPMLVRRVRVVPDLTSILSVELEQSDVELAPVEVRAERPLIRRDLAATSFFVADVQLEHLPITGFADVLRLQPGVTRDGNVRGGRSSDVLYLIDGLPVRDVLSGGLGTDLPRSAVTEMTVMTGGYDAEYGNASSGIVNVVTKSGSSQHVTGMRYERDQFLPVRYVKATDREWQAEFSQRGPLSGETFSYFLSANYLASGTRWWQDAQYAFDLPIRTDANGFIKLDYTPDPGTRWSLQGIYSSQEIRDYEFAWRYNLSGLPNRERRAYRLALQTSQQFGATTFLQASLSAFHSQTAIGTSKTELDFKPYEYDVFLRYVVAGKRNWWADASQTSYTAKVDFTAEPWKNHMLKAGGELTLYDLRSELIKLEPQLNYFAKPIAGAPLLDFSTQFNYRPYSAGFFVQDKVQLIEDGSILTLGLRWDVLDPRAERPLIEYIPVSQTEFRQELKGFAPSRRKHALSPRISLANPIGPQSFFYLNFGQYYQFPVFDLLYSGITPAQIRYGSKSVSAGNPDLEPERVTAWEAGFKHGFSRAAVLTVTYFRKHMTNQIDAKTLIPFDSKYAGDYGFATYVNNAEANASGVEVVLSGEQWQEKTSTLSYTYMVTEGVTESADKTVSRALWGFPAISRAYPLSWDQRHTVKGDISVVLPMAVELNLIGLFHTARPYTFYPTRDGITPLDTTKGFVPNNARMVSVFILDAKMHRTFSLGDNGLRTATVFVDIRNMTNARNVVWMDSNGRVGGELGDPGAYDKPRRIRLGVRVEF